MASHPQLSFTVGMPNMAPDQLSEVELLKIFGDFQWTQLGEAVKRPSHELVNEAGERLYPSFVHVECDFGRNDSIMQFQEGDVVHSRGTVRFHAGQFAEGWAVLGKEEVPHDALAAIETKADLRKLESPWICMTNAIVARMGDNNRLKTFRPAGIQHIDVPVAPETPQGLVEHEQVMQGAEIEPLHETGPLVTLVPQDDSPVVYGIELENDLNGAGLLYFARYVAMMNYAERSFLLRRLDTPFSLPLHRFLSTSARRSYFFANAEETDRVLIRVKGALVEPGTEAPRRSGIRTEVMRLVFRFELHRESDGVLMAKSLVTKALVIPNRLKALHGEARRFLRAIR